VPGGTVGVVPLAQPGKYDGRVRTVAARGSGVTDLAFSPFHDALLATGAEDNAVKVWTIAADGDGPITQPTAVLAGHGRRVEALRFHPTAEQLLATASGQDVRLWDVTQPAAARLTLSGHGGAVHSLAWKADGTLLATTCKDNQLRVWDPRASAAAAAAETTAHVGVKAAVAVWLGDQDRIVTTGFSKVRLPPPVLIHACAVCKYIACFPVRVHAHLCVLCRRAHVRVLRYGCV
jgi:WD40 repeat protein